MSTQAPHKQIRCLKCEKLLAKKNNDGLEIKCTRCGMLSVAFGHLAEQVIITDTAGKILFINKAMETISGYSTQEAIGKKSSELWGGHMSKKFYAQMWSKIRKEKDPVRLVMTNQKKSGELYNLELTISPILDTAGKTLLFVGIENVIQ